MNTETLDFTQPHEITHATSPWTLIPAMKDIPSEFDNGNNKWHRAVSKWFFEGMEKSAFTPKDGIDKDKALRHIGRVLGDWAYKHEHKTAGAAYLMAQWFDDVKL